MAEKIEDLTISYTEDGIETTRELDKVVLSKGSWTTVLYRYQEWERAKGTYSPERYSIRRYQKRNGEYRQQSKFNISSRAQAQAIIDALQQWLNQDPSAGNALGDTSDDSTE
ncbi:hypothetical protein HUU62_01845 [Rhodoferax sp. 4810]|uniref:Uncharacterized protein n=1 Tax=Thiospirillum jenense TaxID=1653858 RepID=A0A839H2F8_9GAMM|nr:hypothetical protein [Thiospirillum jenense]MBB1073156.1 hypothetical protein [Rhodoferax jenense]MBB1124683.1 hypothetical protein [Thiospirillum jenense]